MPHILLISLSLKVINSHNLNIKDEEFEQTDIDEADKLTFTFMHLADAFIQSDLLFIVIFRLYICIVIMCVPWESNPQPFALLTQCSNRSELQ